MYNAMRSHPIFTKPDEVDSTIYIFQSRKLNFREMKWPASNRHTGRRQDSKQSLSGSSPMFPVQKNKAKSAEMEGETK